MRWNSSRCLSVSTAYLATSVSRVLPNSCKHPRYWNWAPIGVSIDDTPTVNFVQERGGSDMCQKKSELLDGNRRAVQTKDQKDLADVALI